MNLSILKKYPELVALIVILIMIIMFSVLSVGWYNSLNITDEPTVSDITTSTSTERVVYGEAPVVTSTSNATSESGDGSYGSDIPVVAPFDLVELGNLDPVYSYINCDCIYSVCYDVTYQRLIYKSSDLDTRIYPASTTKLFTALYALTIVDDVSREVTVGEELDFVSNGSSLAKIQKGEVLTFEMLLQGLLLPSGNDCAYTIAAECGRIIMDDPTLDARVAVDTFVEGMNDFANLIGLNGTHFTCPDGFHDDDHYTTLRDMLMITIYCLDNEIIMDVVGTPTITLTSVSGVEHIWNNTNMTIRKGSGYYLDYVIGMKTGYTGAAGYCLVTAAQKDGRTVVTLSYSGTSTQRFSDPAKMYNKAFALDEDDLLN